MNDIDLIKAVLASDLSDQAKIEVIRKTIGTVHPYWPITPVYPQIPLYRDWSPTTPWITCRTVAELQ